MRTPSDFAEIKPSEMIWVMTSPGANTATPGRYGTIKSSASEVGQIKNSGTFREFALGNRQT